MVLYFSWENIYNDLYVLKPSIRRLKNINPPIKSVLMGFISIMYKTILESLRKCYLKVFSIRKWYI